jgi:hypothetical protein
MKMDTSDKDDLVELLVAWLDGYDLRELDDVVRRVKIKMALNASEGGDLKISRGKDVTRVA